MSSALRTNLLKLHLWVGLHVAIYFILMFVTGAALVFRGELNNLVQPVPVVAVPADAELMGADQLYDALSAQYETATIYNISVPTRPGRAVSVNLFDPVRGQINAIADPYSGAVLVEHKKQTIVQYIRDMHASLLIPRRVGFLLVSSSSLILFFSVVSGLISYRRFWRGLARMPSSALPDRARWGGWHRLLGLWVAPFLLITALSGLYFFAKDIGVDGSSPPPPPVSERQDTRPPGFGAATIRAATDSVARQFPNFELAAVALPDGPRKPITLKGVNAPGGIMAGQSYFVDPVTLQVLGGTSPWDSTGLRKISPWIIALHYGNWGGLGVRILWVVFSLGATALIFAGLCVYVARSAASGPESGSALLRFWRGMGLIRWAYLLLAAGMAALTLLRYVL